VWSEEANSIFYVSSKEAANNLFSLFRRETVTNLVKLIEEDECTVPFIARYRKEATNRMEADTLRQFVQMLSELR